MPAQNPLPTLYPGLPPDSVGETDLATVALAMAALEQSALVSIDTGFHAYDWLPDFGSEEWPYPLSFLTAPTWGIVDRRMGAMSSGSDYPWAWTAERVILTGLASNATGPMTRLTEKFVIPWYMLYTANRTVSGTLRRLEFGPEDGRMGVLPWDNIMHFGAAFPVILRQLRAFPE